jgi:hypothetical protein
MLYVVDAVLRASTENKVIWQGTAAGEGHVVAAWVGGGEKG